MADIAAPETRSDAGAVVAVGRGQVDAVAQPAGAEPDLLLSISVTTRKRRPSEVDGVHYHFIDAKRFEDMRERRRTARVGEVHGNLYATPRGPVEEALAGGRDVLFDIDWQGTRQIAEAMPKDIVRVFVLPPSMAELRARLERRARIPAT
jgi:guanylate kinase